jgi:hypothetical protein
MHRITDKTFRYTPSFNTDLRKSFRKYAQEAKEREERMKAAEAAAAGSVVAMAARRAAALPSKV